MKVLKFRGRALDDGYFCPTPYKDILLRSTVACDITVVK
jgi:hypothetical protein